MAISLLVATGKIGRKYPLKVFVSHALADYKQYKLDELTQNLERQKPVGKVEIWEMYAKGDLREWMEVTVHLLLFIATPNSKDSEPCQFEIETARANGIPIIPLKDVKLPWSDLQHLGLDTERGFIHDPIKMAQDPKTSLAEFSEVIKSYNDDFQKLRKLLTKAPVSPLVAMREALEITEELNTKIIKMIKNYTRILLRAQMITGVWNKDEDQFLRADEVLRRIKNVDPKRTIKDIKRLAELAKISDKNLNELEAILTKGKQKIKKSSKKPNMP